MVENEALFLDWWTGLLVGEISGRWTKSLLFVSNGV